MTTDQLAQLRAIAEQYTANAVRIDYREREIALAALPRLLSEREMLLAALEDLLRLGERFGPAAGDRARAVIAKALA